MSDFLKVENLSKTYLMGNEKLHVLSDVSFEVAQGEMVSIVGASGAGKSTLLHIMGALDHPSSGEVFYNNSPLFKKNEKELSHFRNQQVGFVFQFHHLLPEFNALENVMMPALIAGIEKSQASQRATEFLQEMGLEKRFHHKPSELSGGEQQRVAIARALILKPAVLLADELTGNLDRVTGEKIQELLYNLNKKFQMTMIIVTHNEHLAQKCPRQLKLVDGKLQSL